MKKLLLAIIAFLLVLFLGLYSWSFMEDKNSRYALKEISKNMVLQDDLFIKDITEFEWDRMCAIGIDSSIPPNLSEQEIRLWLNASIDGKHNKIPNVLYSDEFALIPLPGVQLVMFFLKNNSVVEVLSFKRPYIHHNNRRFFIWVVNPDGTERLCADSRDAVIRYNSDRIEIGKGR